MTDFNKLKVTDLRAELKKRGLPQAGLKPALVARLTAAEAGGDESESEATVQGDAAKLDGGSEVTSPDTVSPVLPSGRDILHDAPQTTLESADKATLQESTNEDSLMAGTQPEPSTLIGNPADTVESSQSPEAKDEHKSALPSVEPQEAIEDRQKRKRRSESPPISAVDAARKRFRPSNEGIEAKDFVTSTTNNQQPVDKHNHVDAADVNAAVREVAPSGVEAELVNSSEDHKMEIDVPEPTTQDTPDLHHDSASRTRDSRFKNLFPGDSAQTTVIAKSESAGEEAEPDRIISPAIHPATSALYIRDIMRPLNPAQLKAHIASLATPPGRETDPDVILTFHIDSIRTHAFISFTNISSASRVRSALHDRIWPDEKTRKPLWVDFVPVEKLDEWIEIESAAPSGPGGRSMAKKWEVYYEFDSDRHVTAILQEANSPVPARPNQGPPTRKPSIPFANPQSFEPVRKQSIPNVPTGPRAPVQSQTQTIASNHARLDDLFNSTKATPVLYWKPAPKELAHKRLDAIDASLSKNPSSGRKVNGELNRYTFEDSTVLVDRGPEIFPGIRPPKGYRAPIPGVAEGGFRGGRRGGGFGGGGRGGGGYDSYRRDDGPRRGSGGYGYGR